MLISLYLKFVSVRYGSYLPSLVVSPACVVSPTVLVATVSVVAAEEMLSVVPAVSTEVVVEPEKETPE